MYSVTKAQRTARKQPDQSQTPATADPLAGKGGARRGGAGAGCTKPRRADPVRARQVSQVPGQAEALREANAHFFSPGRKLAACRRQRSTGAYDETLPLTVGEYEEWGNPNEREAYFRIKSYCPYTNIARAAYPTMLVRTSLNDSQVMYWEPAKYIAKLRTHKTDPHPLLFVINMDAGHGGSSGRYDYLKETALDYAFILGT